MIQEIQHLLDSYINWLKNKTQLRKIGEWVGISTPYLDRHNDYIQLYAKKDSNGYVLTDDGYTIDDLRHGGCEINTPKREHILQETLNGFGIKYADGQLQVHTSGRDFALSKHNLVQAVLAVNDMFYLSSTSSVKLFHEDVKLWLDENEIRYTPKITFAGKTGFNHQYDFVIPKSSEQPERILKVVNAPNKNVAEVVIFSWLDTKETRPSGSKAYAILNDSERQVSTAITEALESYSVKPILWGKREMVRKELVA
ncbi:DUF1829 domain-containing protein [bacterium]|nr:DUF1829 domain-containing protein [bacterium]